MSEATEAQKSWTPLDSQIDYVCGLLEAVCWLWRDEDEQTVLLIITRKFTKTWPFIWRMFPAPPGALRQVILGYRRAAL